MFRPDRRSFVMAFTAAAALMIAGCQTARQPGLWSAAQIAALTEAGFIQTERGWEFSMNDRLLFPSDQGNVDPAQAATITRIARGLLAVAIRHVTIEGHTDNTGRSAHNLTLSKRRAQSVAQLFEISGFAAGDIVTVGLGARYPVESNASSDGRRENRRVVVLITAP
ncbi:OmpA family protein [Sphingomonas sp.]|uniref:OmpA family protein n=1 Tax=Sphingomonas sp. TaxID=28214 RepID=UPI002B7DB9E4|nr:OmpA family protein [Sphingomonas sp.]HWK35879.1 OmpA family protein [Sphingomonas sp.]